MATLQLGNPQPLKGNSPYPYVGIAYDGYSFYLTLPQCCQVHRYDHDLCYVDCIHTQDAYVSLCYDFKDHCFWALCAKVPNQLYKLDCSFRQIGSITPRLCDEAPLCLTGVAYHMRRNTLLLSFGGGIGEVEKAEHPPITLLQAAPPCTEFTCVESAEGCYLYGYQDAQEQGICVSSPCDHLPACCTIPKKYQLWDMAALPMAYCGSIGQKVYLLTVLNECASYIIEGTLCCSSETPPNPCDRAQGCNDLLESVALMEAALAHILNAEGEKIQKVVATEKSCRDILLANDSVLRTLVGVTHMEQILYDKLTLIKAICCDSAPCPCHPADKCRSVCP
ncbi:MAG: hypothetical protein RR367_10255 [Clostridia bacterium]